MESGTGWKAVKLLAAGVEPVPEETANEVAGAAAAAFNLAFFKIDIETLEESCDAVVGEAPLAQDLNLSTEEINYLRGGEALGLGACSLSKLTGGDGDLVNGVGASLCHGVPLDVVVGKVLSNEDAPVPSCSGWMAIHDGYIGAHEEYMRECWFLGQLLAGGGGADVLGAGL